MVIHKALRVVQRICAICQYNCAKNGEDLKIGTKEPQDKNSLTLMTGVIMSGHFLRPPNMLAKSSKTPNILTKFSETKLSLSQTFNPSQNQIALLKYQTDSELALKISDPKYVNLPSVFDHKYFFQSSLDPKCFFFSPQNLRPQIC